MEANDVRMRDMAKDVDLLKKAIMNLRAELLLIDLLHGDLHPGVSVAAMPDDGKGARPDLRAKHVVADEAATKLLHCYVSGVRTVGSER